MAYFNAWSLCYPGASSRERTPLRGCPLRAYLRAYRAVRSTLDATTSPMELRTQQFVIVVTGRMQQGDALAGHFHLQPLAGLDAAKDPAVTRQLRASLRIFHQLDFDQRASRDHDRAIRQCVGADRCHHNDVQMRLDDRSATGKSVRGGPRRTRHNDAITSVRVDILSVDPRLKIEHPAGRQLLRPDVVG